MTTIEPRAIAKELLNNTRAEHPTGTMDNASLRDFIEAWHSEGGGSQEQILRAVTLWENAITETIKRMTGAA